MDDASLENARDYYGRVVSASADLRTDACVTTEAPPRLIREALANVHEEVSQRYFGCGLVAPQALDGARVLDLGCGAGRDAYVLAQLAGPHGEVVGVDATPAQLAVARRHEAWHRERFGFPRSTVRFLDGDIGRLDALGLEPESFDVIVSNCVVNLVDDKAAVFAGAHRLLKPGGELYFSDVYADRRLPPALKRDPVLHGECLAGALYWGDFLRLAKAAGFLDPRLVADRPLSIGSPEIAEAVAPARSFSATWRLFKLEGLEPACEDYGQAVCYRGGLPGSERAFALDKHHLFEAGRIAPVCGNTLRMLRESRFADYFDVHGEGATHLGVFVGCGTDLPFSTGPDATPTGGCC